MSEKQYALGKEYETKAAKVEVYYRTDLTEEESNAVFRDIARAFRELIDSNREAELMRATN